MESRGDQPIGPTDWVLFFAVLGGCFGNAIVMSAMMGAAGATPVENLAISTGGMLSLVGFELFAGFVAVVALVACGWRGHDFPMRSDAVGTALGLALAAIVFALNILLPDNSAVPDTQSTSLTPATISVPALLLVSTVNPVFEEFFVLGFIVRFFERRGVPQWPFSAIAASALVRTSYHLYQGFTVLPLHFAMGILFAALFVRRRDLWPMIVAHVLLDLLALLPFSTGGG